MRTENQTIDAILSGEKSAFEELVRSYQQFALTTAYRILKDEDEAEEAAQDAFINAYRNLRKFNRQSKFATWFYRIITNEALGRLRKRKMQKVDLDQAVQVGGVDVYEGDRGLVIHEALAALSDKDAELLSLFYLREFSLQEIADMLTTPINTIKVSLHRARQRMAKEIVKMIGDETYDLLKN